MPGISEKAGKAGGFGEFTKEAVRHSSCPWLFPHPLTCHHVWLLNPLPYSAETLLSNKSEPEQARGPGVRPLQQKQE